MPRQKLGTSRRRGGTNREPAGDGISIDNSDTRSPQQRFADGFVDAMRRVGLDGDLPAKGGDRPRVLVTVDFEHLNAGVGCGTMADTTDQLASPGTVRRLACDAQIIPIVLGGDSQILDQGRGCRTAQGPLRTAVRRYHAPHQLRGPRRGFHHRLYDDGTWSIRFAGDGIPESIPPAGIDPGRRPRCHERFHERRAP